MSGMNWELFGISCYVLLMLVLGAVVSKRIATDDDYFLAGRSLGPFLTTFSVFATWFGAETCIGTAGNVYRQGLAGAHADPLGYGLCILLMGIFFTKVLWNKKITTIPDLYRQRWSPGVEQLAAFIMIPSSLLWAGAQIRAFGHIIATMTDFGVFPAITVAALVVIVYTVSGGLLADAYTDLIQGIALIVGLIFLVIALGLDLGGPSGMWAAIPKEKLHLFHPEAEGGILARLELWLVPILGSLMAQELVSRVVASRSSKIAVRSTFQAAGMYFLIGMMPVVIGLIGVHYVAEGIDGDTILPLLAKQHLPFWAYIVFIGALISAILSTVDSTLLAVSALATHNLLFPFRPGWSEKKKVLAARLGSLGAGLGAYGIAFTSDSVTELVEMASGLGGPIILVMTCFALFTKVGNHVCAWVAMVSALVTWVVGHLVLELEAPVLLTVVVCLGMYVLSLLWTGPARKEV